VTRGQSHFLYAAFCVLSFLPSCVNAEPQKLHFIDATVEAGIDFTHTNGAKGDYHFPETLGSGGGFLDYDNDGDLDLYLVNSGHWPNSPDFCTTTSALYRNNDNGTFSDVTGEAGVENRGNYGHGAACGDYDNDGNSDLYVTNFGQNVLYRNNGDGTFTDVTGHAGVGDPSWSSSATFLDYDRDGALDLYVVNYVDYALEASYPPCADNSVQGYCHPKYYEGASDRLYRNNGDGTFTDATKAAGINDSGGPFHGKGLGVVAADFDKDGWPDLYVANDDTPNYLFYNKGDGTFAEIAVLAGCAYSIDGVAQGGMGVDVGDYNGDGFPDIFVTNFSHETNTLYKNNDDGTFTDVSYKARLGEESYLRLGFGTGFFDYDNDGDLDVFVANGHIFEHVERMTDMVSYAQPNQLFRNEGRGIFTEMPFPSNPRVSRGTIFGDYDNDGDIDLVVTNLNGKAKLWRNEQGNTRNWLRIRTQGSVSNRDGVGTRITVKAADYTQSREVRAGYSYLCSNDPRLFFGLHDAKVVESIEIRWLSGRVQTLKGIEVNQEIIITEINDW